ncbi:MAG: hypothetical protein IT353_11305 [Gemmatimonadaceae bacterium]|nr:hypothetical protein [Gemmatimonadaceae bacterium]
MSDLVELLRNGPMYVPRPFLRALVSGCGVLAFTLGACRQSPAVVQLFPAAGARGPAELSEATLDATVICHDTLGRPVPPGRVIEVTRCSPCMPYGVAASAERARLHGRRLWNQGARAPYDSTDAGATCARLAFAAAQRRDPDNDALAVERALVELAHHNDTIRARALDTLDARLGARRARGDRAAEELLLGQLAIGIWDRAQRQLERPAEISVQPLERAAHDLARNAPRLTHLPAVPPTSPALGVSEAEWAARLFEAAARAANNAATRSKWLRLSVAPWVVLGAWTSLDSAAGSLLRFAPNDSSLLPARGLAAYRRMTTPVRESPRVMLLFDSAVSHMPRVDSARYDSFDGVLTASDDEWRYGFYPDQRLSLDQRGWSVLDPMWSTPLNEIQLERRARVAESDYRYADLAKAGQAGSETRAGEILLRRGLPDARWSLTTSRDRRQRLQRGWRSLYAMSAADNVARDGTNNSWRIFYGPSFSMQHVSTFPLSASCASDPSAFPSLHSCAMHTRSDWSDAQFYGRTETLDVTIARFRAGGDSADVYVGARIPVRPFIRSSRPRGGADSVDLGVWLTDEIGHAVYRATSRRALPSMSDDAWTAQWSRRVGTLRLMHRVEAIEPTQPIGSRGAARFTDDAQVLFPLRGFGMSDVLVADRATPQRADVRRWSDLTLVPNGGTVPSSDLFSMAWELYDLTPGADGLVRWRVRIKRERGAEVSRTNMKDVLSGSNAAGSRVVGNESTAPDMSYTRQGKADAVVVEYVRFGLGNAPVGTHAVRVTIDDLISGKSVTRGVSVRVVR